MATVNKVIEAMSTVPITSMCRPLCFPGKDVSSSWSEERPGFEKNTKDQIDSWEGGEWNSPGDLKTSLKKVQPI